MLRHSFSQHRMAVWESGHMTLSLSLSLPPSAAPPRRPSRALYPPLSHSHSAAAPSAAQLSRSTARSHIYAHTRSRPNAHTRTCTREHAQPPAGSPRGAAAFCSGVQSAPSPGNGRRGWPVSERSERRSEVLLIGDAGLEVCRYVFRLCRDRLLNSTSHSGFKSGQAV